jgi:hypothetical protein
MTELDLGRGLISLLVGLNECGTHGVWELKMHSSPKSNLGITPDGAGGGLGGVAKAGQLPADFIL